MDGRGSMALVPGALGAAFGAAASYFVDPCSGRRRRALARDKAVHIGHRLNRLARAAARDARNRALGLAIESAERLGGRLAGEPLAVADDVLAARVRAELGHVVRHPRSVEVSVADGRVTLAGVVERDGTGAERLMRRVRTIPGVVAVVSRFSPGAPLVQPASPSAA
jgi:hypothetical protein